MRKASSVLALMISAAIAPVFAQTSSIQYSLQIDRQPLVATLRDLSEQTGLQLVGLLGNNPEEEGRLVGPLNGDYTAEAALDALLAQSGYVFKRVNDKTIAIVGRYADKRGQSAATDRGFFMPREAGGRARGSLQWRQISNASGPEVAPAADSSGRDSRRQVDTEGGVVEEVLVTGTYIRGAAPVGSPLKVYTRENIDRSGAATVEQFARHMTENFSSADLISNKNAASSRFGSGSSSFDNAYSGAAFNLRGLGPSSTLTLLNGSRMAPGGQQGGASDISLIPLSAVERIEVLPDGASAIYGADAVAGVVNIITRDDFEGAETSVRYGGATEGGVTQLTASQMLGTGWDSGNALLNYQYGEQSDLDASERSFIPNQGGALSLIPENRSNSVLLAGSQSFGARTKLTANAVYGERDTTARNRLHRNDIVQSSVQANEVSQTGASMSLSQEMFDDWNLSFSGNYSRVEQAALERSRNELTGASATTNLNADSQLTGADLLVNGTLLDSSVVALKGALGASYREEQFENSSRSVNITPTGIAIPSGAALPDLDRRVKSVFAELRMPLFADAASPRRLELSLAGRYDDYSDVGSASTYKAGLGWRPVSGLHLRGTFGTSFRAPQLTDLGAATLYNAGPSLPDPSSPTGFSNYILITGGNPALGPEEAESFTAGVDFEPAFLPDLTMGLTYFDIDFEDRIAAPNITGLFTMNPVAAPFLTRNPPLSAVQAIFAQPTFNNFFGLTPAQIGLIYDPRVTNLASTRQSGLDLTTRYSLDTELGNFAVTLSAAHLLKNETQNLPGQSAIEYLNTFAQPSKWKARGGLSWTVGQLNTSLTVNYVNSYRNGLGMTATNPGSNQSIDAWTTADLYVGYTTGDSLMNGLLGDLSVALSVNNLTDEDPPFVQIPTSILGPGQRVMPFDATNASPLGRFISLQVTKQWR